MSYNLLLFSPFILRLPTQSGRPFHPSHKYARNIFPVATVWSSLIAIAKYVHTHNIHYYSLPPYQGALKCTRTCTCTYTQHAHVQWTLILTNALYSKTIVITKQVLVSNLSLLNCLTQSRYTQKTSHGLVMRRVSSNFIQYIIRDT